MAIQDAARSIMQENARRAGTAPAEREGTATHRQSLGECLSYQRRKQ
jgi:hypothetical protein